MKKLFSDQTHWIINIAAVLHVEGTTVYIIAVLLAHVNQHQKGVNEKLLAFTH